MPKHKETNKRNDGDRSEFSWREQINLQICCAHLVLRVC